MRAIYAISAANLRRLFRVRTNIFFVFLFPMLLILILGATFGGSAKPRLGVVDHASGPIAGQLLHELQKTPHLRVVRIGNTSDLTSQVARNHLEGGLVIPDGYDAAIARGAPVRLRYVGRFDNGSQQLAERVRGAVARQAMLLGAARLALSEHAAPTFAAALSRAEGVAATVPRVGVEQTAAGRRTHASVGQFDESAWTELLLFLFLTALTGAVALIETRRLGVSRRVLSTPTPPSTVIVGETVSRLVISVIQAFVVILGSALLFGVKWGDPLGVAAVVIVFSLVAAGAGIFLGTVFGNEQQAMGASLLAGLGLAALGGCMVPLEVFSSTMKRIAHFTPHAWANDAFAKLVGHGASITDIGQQLGALAAFAVGLLALATWRLRRVLLH